MSSKTRKDNMLQRRILHELTQRNQRTNIQFKKHSFHLFHDSLLTGFELSKAPARAPRRPKPVNTSIICCNMSPKKRISPLSISTRTHMCLADVWREEKDWYHDWGSDFPEDGFRARYVWIEWSRVNAWLNNIQAESWNDCFAVPRYWRSLRHDVDGYTIITQ